VTPAVVVDVGNTRIKWGRCIQGSVVEVCSLPGDDPAAWSAQAECWGLSSPIPWAVSGVAPARRDRLADWLRQRGDRVRVIDDPAELPLRVLVPWPGGVGVDRLLDAVAANSRRTPGRPAVLIDAGSAVTVDHLDENGSFTGGVILPGLRLMAQALHDYTALLPLVEPPRQIPPVPATDTRSAVEAGVFWTAAGGIRALVGEYARRPGPPPEVFLTGGDAELLNRQLSDVVDHSWPAMTLEGVRLSVEALP
jgi:type III pantothenate kinase